MSCLPNPPGLLFEPGDAADLAQKIERLLDDPELQDRLGRAGRQRFDDQFTWDVVITRHYRHLLGPAQRPAENRRQQREAVTT